MKNLNSIVGIITYHKSLSYGACLQAIATQECVRKLMNSDEVYLIDYVNEYEARQKSWQFIFNRTTLIISKKPGNTGISRDIRTEFTTDLLLSD